MYEFRITREDDEGFDIREERNVFFNKDPAAAFVRLFERTKNKTTNLENQQPNQ